jgi:hypothetical protein
MQWKNRSTYVRSAVALMAAAGLTMLGGCGVNGATPPADPQGPPTLQGQVFAARNYMAGATVNIYVTQPNGVATNGVYVGTAKLLKTVTANSTGGWSVTGLTCSSPDQLYVTAAGGVPYPSGSLTTTLSNNPNSLLMTAIGDCSILSSQMGSNNITTVVTNEASTVAALWALRNFISVSGTTVNITSSASNYSGTSGVGVPGSFAGLAHAFLNANNLAPYYSGNFVQYTNGATQGTPGTLQQGSVGGLVPVQELNSLAYAQYLCTIGAKDGATAGDFTYCTQLFGLTTPPGGSAPTNSLQAMLNIANNPENNATAILNFTLTPIPGTTQTGSQQINAGVYVPALTGFGSTGAGGATGWTVAIYYLAGYGSTDTAQGSTYPFSLTIDADDNVYFSNPNGSTSSIGNVIALSSNGTNLWTSPNDTTNLTTPRGIAADASGHLWVANGSTTAGQGFVQEMDATSGNLLQRYTTTATSLYDVAVDSLGNVWYGSTATAGQDLFELALSSGKYTPATFPVPPSSSLGLYQIRPDGKNNIWASGYSTASATALYFANSGTSTAPAYGGALQPVALTGTGSFGVAPDASGNAYLVTNGASGGIFKATVTGSGASSTLKASSIAANNAANSRFLDIDGQGAMWYLDETTGTFLYQVVPGTTPTVFAHYPCYNSGTTSGTGTATSTVQTCSTGLSTKQDLAIDSTGSIWVASYGNSGGGRMVQIIGAAAPTIPLRALGKPGVMP